MKFIYSLVVFILFGTISFAQVDFILSGQTTDMIFTDYEPDLSFSSVIGASHQSSDSVFLDINRDGTNDYQFKMNSSSSPGGNSATYSLQAFNQNLILTTNSSYIKFTQGGYTFNDTSMYVVGKRTLFGDTIFNKNDTMWKGGRITLYSGFNIAGTSASLRDNTVAFDSTVYFSLKVVAGTDTLLGYLHISAQNSVMDFACQGTTSVYVISSVKDFMHPSIILYPNPFSKQLNLSVSNSFDYQIVDLQGRVVANGKAIDFIPTNDLPLGSYLLVLKSENFSFSKRLMKVGK